MPVRGATLPVYRGMLHRRVGRLDEAIEDLSFAVATKPSRVGARMELCLALRAAGRRAEATEHARTILVEAAPLLVSVARARRLDWRVDPSSLLGDDVLEAALAAMRGNRSSAVVSWIDDGGNLCVLEHRGGLEEQARAVLAWLGRTG
jgi:hypothetical protein